MNLFSKLLVIYGFSNNWYNGKVRAGVCGTLVRVSDILYHRWVGSIENTPYP